MDLLVEFARKGPFWFRLMAQYYSFPLSEQFVANKYHKNIQQMSAQILPKAILAKTDVRIY